MGRLAVAALADASGDPDPEVRMRVDLLLPRAEADDLRARVETFLADTQGQFTHDLPGWARFQSITGNNPPARDLYATAVKNPNNFSLLRVLRGVPTRHATGLAAVAGGLTRVGADRPPAVELARAIVARRFQMMFRIAPPFLVVPGFRPRLPDAPDVALLLCAESLVSEADLPPRLGYQVGMYLETPAGREAVAGNGVHGPAFQSLTRRWLDTRDGWDGAMTAARLAQTLSLPNADGARYAARVLTVHGAQPYHRANAAVMLVGFQGTAYVMQLPKLFEDRTIILKGGVAGAGNVVPDVFVGDVALAAAILLTRQDPKVYGFTFNPRVPPGMRYSQSHYRFQTDDAGDADEKRGRAVTRWREWELGQVGSVVGAASAVQFLAVTMPPKDPDVLKAEKARERAAAEAEAALP